MCVCVCGREMKEFPALQWTPVRQNMSIHVPSHSPETGPLPQRKTPHAVLINAGSVWNGCYVIPKFGPLNQWHSAVLQVFVFLSAFTQVMNFFSATDSGVSQTHTVQCFKLQWADNTVQTQLKIFPFIVILSIVNESISCKGSHTQIGNQRLKIWKTSAKIKY